MPHLATQRGGRVYISTGKESAIEPSKPTVVLVDDMRESLNTWEQLLQSTCTVVATAADGPSALDAIRKFKPDVAVLDITMPGLTGLEVARRAIEEQPKIRIVLCSIMRDAAVVQGAADIGVHGYVMKMNVFHDLANAVAAVAAGGSFFPGFVIREGPA